MRGQKDMFSGIVETTGKVTKITMVNGCQEVTIAHSADFQDLIVGDSIAVNGVCLTITTFTHNTFTVTAVPETLRCTNLNHIQTNDSVNLERSIQMGGRLGGHLVQGHVDDIGTILEMSPDNSNALLAKIHVPERLMRYIVQKGYITLDGMSMTVVETSPIWFSVTIIPHTQHASIAQHYHIGSAINIEVDILSKYIEKLLGVTRHATTSLH